MVIFSKHKANYLSGMITDEPSVLALLDRMKAQLLEAIEKGE